MRNSMRYGRQRYRDFVFEYVWKGCVELLAASLIAMTTSYVCNYVMQISDKMCLLNETFT